MTYEEIEELVKEKKLVVLWSMALGFLREESTRLGQEMPIEQRKNAITEWVFSGAHEYKNGLPDSDYLSASLFWALGRRLFSKGTSTIVHQLIEGTNTDVVDKSLIIEPKTYSGNY